MKKVASILAVVLFSMGLISCESESTADTDALFDIEATDGDVIDDDSRD
ncbi:MAG: hypothetical protein AAFO99_16195 [Bacteroidota bacterium]